MNTKKIISTPKGTPHLNKRTLIFSRVKRRVLKHVWLARVSLLLGVTLGFYLLFFIFGFILRGLGTANYPGLVMDFVLTPTGKIKSMAERTNIVILGKGGEGHAGGNLTDTIIFASMSLARPGAVLISIPRDIWVPAIRAKINSAYYWGNQRQPAGGLILAKSEVEAVVGQPIQYGVVVDFAAFKKIIDVLDGIDILVERSFVDEKYPVAGRENDECGGDPEVRCRYEILRFARGKQLMNGETALKFVRSRNAEGDEGTDIAREARQQKVIAAIKEKLLNPKTFLNFPKMFAIWRVVKESVETDLDGSSLVILARRALQSNKAVKFYVLPDGSLTNPPISPRYDNQYVFVPKVGSWKDIHDWVSKLLER